MQRQRAATLVLLLTALVVGTFPITSFGLAGTATVVMEDSIDFNPRDARIQLGDTVTWVYPSQGHDPTITHTSTSDSGQAESWDSQQIVTSFSHTFQHAGTFTYHCTVHSGMTGSVFVNGAPTISISSPATSQGLRGSVTFAGTASDPNGDSDISKVELQIDGGSFQAVSGTTSWTFGWDSTTVADGSHTVRARVTDAGGMTGTDTRTYTVRNNDPPSISIALPSPNADLTHRNITLTGTASDPQGSTDLSKVEVSIDTGAYQLATGTDSWSFTWDARNATTGEHAIHVRVTDKEGATGAATENVNVTNAAPSIAIASPMEGASVGLANVTFSGTASDDVGISRVDWRVDGGTWRVASGTKNWSFVWDAHAALLGSHDVTVRANESDGTQNATAVRRVVVISGNAPPTIAITAPAKGVTVSGLVNITGSASDDGGVARVEIALDGGAFANATGKTAWHFLWDATNATVGPHVVHARARETDGTLQTNASVAVNVSAPPVNAPPTLEILSPNAGTSVDKSVTFTGNASDDGSVAAVEYRAAGDEGWTRATGTTNWRFTLDTSALANGSLSVEMRAREGDGRLVASTNRTVTVHHVPAQAPGSTIRITVPSDGTAVKGKITIAGLASGPSGAIVSVLGLPATIDASDAWSVSWDSTKVSNGLVRIVASVRSANGTLLASSPPVEVTVANPGPAARPTILITTPANGDTVTGDGIIRVKVTDPSGAPDDATVTLDNATLLSWTRVRGEVFATWSSVAVTNGPHTLVATAKSGSVAVASAPVTITVANAGPSTIPLPTTTTSPSTTPTPSPTPASNTPLAPDLAFVAIGLAASFRRLSRRTG